ncbi:uncharacterized protein YjiS (DUF1127 family) [Loktanella ponticola]|uniref:Uncharacterized protein YjiS (DUF1127 family) n=1 Tax=Yoonia ponticola TaxID=1524255 RepID=A0A7W9F0Q2_9RHOB|nr:hypothetical protein [Yoonia ponticola]MBB5723161.1 uncharacterized protein YjiS (DUF1127 family) [Yoonia ponticola]
MSTYNMNTMMTNREMALAFVRVPFQAVKDVFVAFAHAVSRAEQLETLNEMSDEDLAARGMTRAEAAQAILRS